MSDKIGIWQDLAGFSKNKNFLPLRLKTSQEGISIGVQQIIKLDEQKTKNFFSGLIDYVLVQDEALSNDEIYDIINA